MVFLSYLDGRNSSIIGLHSLISFTTQLHMQELINHVWFNHFPIYDPRSWSLFATWTPKKNPVQLEAFSSGNHDKFLFPRNFFLDSEAIFGVRWSGIL